MKNSKEYSKKVQKLYRALKRKYPKPQKVLYDNPLDAIVYAVVAESVDEATTKSAMKGFTDRFVDWNDLRVSHPDEIIEAFGPDNPAAEDIASKLIEILRAIFQKYNTIDLEALKKMSKRPARQALEKIENITRFTVDYCMLTSLQGHAIPLTATMIEYLKGNELIHPDADQQEIEGFLSRQISAANGYRFYAFLRAESESVKSKAGKKFAKKKKAKTSPKTKKKTKKSAVKKTKKKTKKNNKRSI